MIRCRYEKLIKPGMKVELGIIAEDLKKKGNKLIEESSTREKKAKSIKNFWNKKEYI